MEFSLKSQYCTCYTLPMSKTTNTPHSQINLTPNSRLARHLRQGELTHSISNNKLLAYQVWLKTLYTQTLFTTEQPLQLLTAEQESLLWENIVKNSAVGTLLLQIESTTKTAQQAYAMLRAWNVSPNQLVEEAHNPDIQAFYEWSCLFQQQCQEQRLLSAADLTDWLIKNLAANALPEAINLINFDDLNPKTLLFLQHCEKLGCKVSHQQLTTNLDTCHTVSCYDLDEELFTMARWAKAIVDKNSEYKIVCIVPNLNQIRSELQSCFAAVFNPASAFNPELEQQVYNISGGYPLSTAPIIHTAIQILSLNAYKIDYQILGSFLLSPFINGYQAEMLNRAMTDSALRDLDEPALSWRLVLATLQQQTDEFTPMLLTQLTQWLALRRSANTKQTLALWQKTFYDLLHAFGWPGERTLNSTEHQQVKRFFTLLQALPSLTLDTTTYNYHDALQILQKSCRDTLFEIESHDGPVQVLGLLEAAGINADYCWMMHLDDETWPAAASPNALLPYHLQRAHNMPHSSAERELRFSEQMQQRLQKSNRHIIMSYHQHDGDRELNISPLISSIKSQTTSNLLLAEFTQLSQSISKAPECELLTDNAAPAISATETTPGGTGIFKQQAACPFRAFASYRLHATGLMEAETGLTALERGSVLHSCLDSIWAELKTQACLISIDEMKLDTIISSAIETAFQACFPKYSGKLNKRFKRLETQRLHELLYNWLQHEKLRPAFKVVAHEQWRRAEFGRLTLNLQIDRIDELDNGDRLVIDYKSGKTSPQQWFGERPREPQLPLYCLVEQKVDAISFAEVRNDDMRFKGIAANDLEIKGIKAIADIKDESVPATWNALINDWNTTLQQLADDFFAGIADVDPAYYDTCQYCELHGLCRIGEQS